MQETFLQAYKAASRFRGEAAVYTWLYGILRHLCYQHFRRRKRLVFEAAPGENEPASEGSEAAMDEEHRGTRLTKALQELSLEHREVVMLRYYADLKIQEIAERTGAAPGTVKSRLHYAMKRLAELLPDGMNLLTAADTQK